VICVSEILTFITWSPVSYTNPVRASCPRAVLKPECLPLAFLHWPREKTNLFVSYFSFSISYNYSLLYFFPFSMVFVNFKHCWSQGECTKGFYCDISIHTYNVLWSISPLQDNWPFLSVKAFPAHSKPCFTSDIYLVKISAATATYGTSIFAYHSFNHP
jgi:hypothetical protein